MRYSPTSLSAERQGHSPISSRTKARQAANSSLLWLLVAIAALFATACGSTNGGSSVSADTADKDLSQLASKFGEAYIRGDMHTVVELMSPSDRAKLPDFLQPSFDQATEQSRSVELREFHVVVEMNSDGTATATYSGQRCGPADAAPMTTAVSPGALSAPEAPTKSSAAVSRCVDIAEQSRALKPFTFQRIDGRWYPNLPDLG